MSAPNTPFSPPVFSEREIRVIARVLEPDKYPLPGEDFTDIINEALRAVRRVMDELEARS